MTGREVQANELADLVRGAAPELEEAVKWRRLTFTAGGDWHHWVCAVAASSKGVSLMFHKGALLDDPAQLLRGDARYVRQVPHATAMEYPKELAALLREAIAHQKDMLD